MNASVENKAQEASSKSPILVGSFHQRRMWLPVIAVGVILLFSAIAIVFESPSPSSDDYVSPVSNADIGSSVLADKLEKQGVTVERYTDAAEAMRSTAEDATIFIPAPAYIDTDVLLRSSPVTESKLRFVWVLPTTGQLYQLRVAEMGSRRVATKAVDTNKSCAITEGQKPGTVDIGRQQYRPLDIVSEGEYSTCYDDYFVRVKNEIGEHFIVGAPDVFTNEFINQHDNTALAMNLLSERSTVIWLDIHTTAPVKTNEPPKATSSATMERPKIPISYDQMSTNPLYGILPAWIWALLVGILATFALAGIWRGRRLGAPVVEPLPVTVPAAETAYGRARLYRQSSAYPQVMAALRAGAFESVRTVLGLSSRTTLDELITAVSERTQIDRSQVAAVLNGSPPRSESELVQAVRKLDELIHAVHEARSQGEK